MEQSSRAVVGPLERTVRRVAEAWRAWRRRRHWTQARQDLEQSERELAALASPAGTPEAARWLELIQGVDDLDRAARLQAREAVRATFRRITLWHAGDPPGRGVIEVDVESRTGAVMRLSVARRLG